MAEGSGLALTWLDESGNSVAAAGAALAVETEGMTIAALADDNGARAGLVDVGTESDWGTLVRENRSAADTAAMNARPPAAIAPFP